MNAGIVPALHLCIYLKWSHYVNFHSISFWKYYCWDKIRRWKMHRNNEQKMHISILTTTDWIVSISVAYFHWMKNNLKILHCWILQIPFSSLKRSCIYTDVVIFIGIPTAHSGLALWHFLMRYEKLILWRGYTHSIYKKWEKKCFVLSWTIYYW